MWGESDAGWACARDKTFAEAEAICQAAGARLCTTAELADGCTAGTGCQFDFELVWGVSSPPLPPSTASIVVTLTASGSIDDFPDTSSVQRSVATAASVDAALVTIAMAPGSVIITATIAVPESTTVAAMQTSLASTLGTPAAASSALGITIVETPSITIILPVVTSPPLPWAPPSQSLPPATPPVATMTSLRSKDDAGAQVDFTAILIGGAAAAVALLALLVLASRCVPSALRARCVSQPAFSDWPVAPTLPPQHTGHTTDAVTGAEQAVVEGLRPRRRQGIWIGTQV